MSIIEVKEVKKSFGKGESYAEILKGASFSVEKGEFVSLMGASGSGKSTMLYLIGGLDREFEGEIKINDEDIAKKKEKIEEKIAGKYDIGGLTISTHVDNNSKDIDIDVLGSQEYYDSVKNEIVNIFKLL